MSKNKYKNKKSSNDKHKELLEKLGADSTTVTEDVKKYEGESIVKDGRIDLAGFELKSSTNLGYERKPNYTCKTGYTGCDILILVNNQLNESIRSLQYCQGSLILTVPITSDCDKDYEMLRELKEGTVTELFINEYGHVVVRDFVNVSYESENCNHSIDDVRVENTYRFICDNTTSFKTLSDAQFIERFDKVIKKVDTGVYKSRT